MRVHVKKMSYWKTEHGGEEDCQDACEFDVARGLFAVADGAGTTLYPAIWARIVAQHFMHIPLMSEDAFEIEWWVRQAQEIYKQQVPDGRASSSWNVLQKAQQMGSASTLATLRVKAVTAAEAEAELLVFGDSCVLIGRPGEQDITSFILQKPEEFERGPVCIPSDLRFFRRDLNLCELQAVTLHPGDIAILATDAVSKWILSRGDGIYDKCRDAFMAVCDKQPGNAWFQFIDQCRAQQQMVDDDSTALVIEFLDDRQSDDAALLGAMAEHNAALLERRRQAFEQALRENNKELMAIIYGDGNDLRRCGINLSDEDVEHNRRVADAFKEVVQTMQQTRNTSQHTTEVQKVWARHRQLLQDEPCAAHVREMVDKMNAAEAPAAKHELAIPQLQKEQTQQQERVVLERDLLKSLRYSDDEKLLDVSDRIQQNGYDLQEICQGDFEAYERIQQARRRRQELAHVREVLRKGNIEEIIQQCTHEAVEHLTEDEREQIELAHNFHNAYHAGHDRRALAIWSQMEQPRYRGQFQLTDQEQHYLEIAHRRETALIRLREKLDGCNPQQIVKAYDPLLDQSQELSEGEREQIRLAREFDDAYKRGDGVQVFRAYYNILHSPCKERMAFRDQEGRSAADGRNALWATAQSNDGLVIIVPPGTSQVYAAISPDEYRAWYEQKEKGIEWFKRADTDQEMQYWLSDEYSDFSPYPYLQPLHDLIEDYIIQHAIQEAGLDEYFKFDAGQYKPAKKSPLQPFFFKGAGVEMKNTLEIIHRRYQWYRHVSGQFASVGDWLREREKTYIIDYRASVYATQEEIDKKLKRYIEL